MRFINIFFQPDLSFDSLNSIISKAQILTFLNKVYLIIFYHFYISDSCFKGCIYNLIVKPKATQIFYVPF